MMYVTYLDLEIYNLSCEIQGEKACILFMIKSENSIRNSLLFFFDYIALSCGIMFICIVKGHHW